MATRQQCVPKSRGTMVLPSAVLSLMSLDTFDPEKPTTWPPDAEHWFQVSYPIEVVDARDVFLLSSSGQCLQQGTLCQSIFARRS